MKKIFVLLLLIVATSSGCAKTVDYNLTEDYRRYKPVKVVVLDVTRTSGVTSKADDDGLSLLRNSTIDMLRTKHYSSPSLEEVDKKLKARGLDPSAVLGPDIVASLFQADAVMYIRIIKWDEGRLLSYASLKIGAEFKLYSKAGPLLWNGSYTTKQSDFRLDASTTDMGVLKAYEPRIERIVDTVFLTLPNARKQKKKTRYYQWLP